MENKLFFCANKTFIVSRLLCFCCLFLGLYSCQEEDSTILNTGKLSFQMGVDTTLVGSSSTRASNILELSGFDDPDSYKVVISQDSGVVAEYARFDKMPAEIELEAGAYSVEVSKGTKTAAAFNSPYFYGKQDFTIVKDMTTPVEVTAAMENSRVTVDFSDDFVATYKDYTLSFMTNKMTLPLVYEKGEYRPMYFQADASGTKLTIGMELVNVYGKDVQYTATTTIKQKQWTKLTVRTDEKGLNGVAIDVVLNDETKETVYVNIGIPDFMEQLKGAPSVSSSFFNWDGKETMTEPTILDPKDANTFIGIPDIYVLAGGKVDKAILSVTKDGESVLNIDFANLEEEKKAELESLYAFDLPETIKGQMSFDFDPTGLLNSLKPEKDVNAEYIISLSVTDALPKSNTTTKLVKVVLKEAQDPSFSGLDLIEGTYQKFTEQKSLKIVHTLDLASCSFVLTNSLDEIINRGEVDLVTGKTTVEGINWRKTEDAYYLDFMPTWLNTLQSGKFTLSVTVEDIAGINVVEKIPVSIASVEWLTTENDVFAKYIILKARALDNDISHIKFIYGGKEITEELQEEGEGVVSCVLSGLASGQPHEIILEHNGIEIKGSWTTEEEQQLPNAGFENWYYEQPESNWKRWFPWDSNDVNTTGWNTLNRKTTSDESAVTSNFAYVNNSGTIETTDKNRGEKAALIRTIGWGEGTTAPGRIPGIGYTFDGDIKKADSGYLYLGGESNNPETEYYPYSFQSRPTALTFYRKYLPASGRKVSNDNYEVWIKVEYRNGDQVILLGEGYLKEGGKTTSYELKTIPITYKNSSYKATHLYILFKSGVETEYDYMIVPPYNDLSTGEYIGSQLYIDDVELIYDYE